MIGFYYLKFDYTNNTKTMQQLTSLINVRETLTQISFIFVVIGSRNVARD